MSNYFYQKNNPHNPTAPKADQPPLKFLNGENHFKPKDFFFKKQQMKELR